MMSVSYKEKIMFCIADDLSIRFTAAARKRLDQEMRIAEERNNVQSLKLVWALQLMAKGRSVEDVADILHRSSQTIREWIDRFLVEGFDFIKRLRVRRRGRKPKLTRKQRKQLYDWICSGPESCGFEGGLWSSAMVAELILREFNVTYNPRYVSTLLNKMGLSYQKGAFISDKVDDREHQCAMRRWRCVTWPSIKKRASRENGVILFTDEVSFAQWGSLSYTWAPRGQQPKIKTAGKRKGMKVFGAIEFADGKFIYQEHQGRFNGDSYIVFLKHILSQYRRPVFLIEDNAPYHRSKVVTEFRRQMAAAGRLFVYRLPSYAPELNPIEKLWRNTKRKATHLKYFPTFEDLRHAVLNAFHQYLRDAATVLGVMKKLRAKAGLSTAD